MKKLIALISAVAILLAPINAFAANTHSINFAAASSQYLSQADDAVFDHADGFTWECWVNFNNKPSGGAFMSYLGKGNSAGTFAYDVNFTNNYGGAGAANLAMLSSNHDGTTLSANYAVQLGDLTAGSWYHLAYIYHSATGYFEVVKDGVSLGNSDFAMRTSIRNTAGTATVGRELTNLRPYADYKLDDCRMWSTERTATEIADNRNVELTGSESGLVGYWKFNNDATDETAAANDWTENNSPTYSTSVPFVGYAPGPSGFRAGTTIYGPATFYWMGN